ncbi:MAG TPA: hypothetical protein VFD82_13130 [Planctomycetota bacterium]|nr:hypothetical protein [Planctomycetota bacterium]
MIALATFACRMIAALLLVGAAAAQTDVTRTGKTFAVTLHPGKLPETVAGRLADEALAAAERVRPALDRLTLRPPKKPVIHVYADERPFRALAAETTKLAFPVEGFVQVAAGCAHVLLWPCLEAGDYALVGLPPDTEYQVMLQAVQFAVFQRHAWVKSDPWRADVVAHGIVDEILNPDTATGVDPMFDNRRYWYAVQFAKGMAPKLRDELELTDAPADRGSFDARTEAMGLVAQTLAAAGSGAVGRLLLMPDEKLPCIAAQRAAAVESILGGDWKRIEERFTKILSSLRPRWEVSSPAVAWRAGRLLFVGPAGTESGATLTAIEPPPSGAYAIRATCELVPGRTKELRVQLDWDESSLLACFVQDEEFWVARWDNGGTTWEKLLVAKSPVVAGRPFALSIEVDAKLRVVVDDKQVLEFDYGQRTMRGRWSIAKNLGPVWLTDLRCEPLAPPQQK